MRLIAADSAVRLISAAEMKKTLSAAHQPLLNRARKCLTLILDQGSTIVI